MQIAQFNFPTTIRFGPGVIKELPAILKEKGIKRPFLVSDRTVARLDFHQEVLKDLAKAGLAPQDFHEFEGNPIESHVVDGTRAYKETNADGMVIMGGGAALDVGKAIALLASNPGSLFDYEDIPGAREAANPFPFMVAIPTTAGTGSEVGRSSVISENESKAKKIIFSPKMLPPLVLGDPELTVGLPPSVTAATGMDAFTHCLEAYLAKGFHPLCDGIAIEGISLIAQYLKTAYENPSDLKARGKMLAASMMGAISFQKGLGVNHSCAHALSTVFDLHHGLANALMLPAAMAFNKSHAEAKFARLAHTVGILLEDQAEAAQAFLRWMDQLKKDVGITQTLKDHGVKVSDQLLDVAFNDICHPFGPKPVTRDDFKHIYQEAL